ASEPIGPKDLQQPPRTDSLPFGVLISRFMGRSALGASASLQPPWSACRGPASLPTARSLEHFRDRQPQLSHRLAIGVAGARHVLVVLELPQRGRGLLVEVVGAVILRQVAPLGERFLD